MAIPGISRLRAATTLLATGNFIASRCLQRSRVRAGAGPDNIESCQCRAGGQEGYCASNYEAAGAGDQEKVSRSD